MNVQEVSRDVSKTYLQEQSQSMPIDLSKLTPLPLTLTRGIPSEEPGQVRLVGAIHTFFARFVGCPGIDAEEESKFYVLARQAFDVMMRRREWHAMPCADGKWCASIVSQMIHWVMQGCGEVETHFPDPFTALVETDAWYKANVEK